MDAGSGDGVRWSKGGSRAATGGGDPGSGADDAAQIQALLQSLSQVRLAVSADLSAAAGALEDDRADIAAEVIAGARGELAELRAAARRRESAPSPFPRKVPVSVGGPSATGPRSDPEPRVPEQEIRRPRHRVARALAGAAALAVAIAVIPQVAGGSSHASNGASAAIGTEASPDIRLASSEFTELSQRLLAADAAPATILAAERTWQSAVATSLPNASTDVTAASAVVTMLRQERALLAVSPALSAPANRSLASSLAASSQSLLSRLRQIADPKVLAILPTVLNALAAPTTTTAPVAAATPAPGTGTAPSEPATGTGTEAGTLPTPPAGSTGATNPQAPPSAPASNDPLPSPGPTLPSTLGQLTGGGTDSGGLGQTVGNVLNGLGLGG
jgi:hypothetical protein